MVNVLLLPWMKSQNPNESMVKYFDNILTTWPIWTFGFQATFSPTLWICLSPTEESVAAAIERQTPNLMWTASSTGTYNGMEDPPAQQQSQCIKNM